MRIVRSNQIEELFFRLKQRLFRDGANPWQKRLIIVPNVQMREWLYFKIADDRGILAGIEVLLPYQGIEYFQKIPSKLKLSLQIESHLEKISDPLLKKYLKKKSPTRKSALSEELAALFLQYLRADAPPTVGFQKKLWDLLQIPSMDPEKKEVELYIFAVSSFTQKELIFFSKVANTFFHLSPSEMFFGDFVTDQRRGRLGSKFDSYLEENSSLLSNLGMVCQKTDRHLEYIDEHQEECYVKGEEKTALEKVKLDLLTLSQPRTLTSDHSIQFHLASSPRREVEIVKQLIEEALQEREPKEIVVMAPNLKMYVPYLLIHFPEAKIRDIEASFLHPLIQTFLHLLNLPFSRYDAASLLRLLEEPAFLRKQRLLPADVETIRRYIERVGIRWGKSLEHRESYLEKEFCDEGMVEKVATGTWDDGEEKLLMALVMESEIPLEFSSSDALSKWFYTLERLKKDLSFNGERSVAAWCELFHSLYKKYFDGVGGEAERLITQTLLQLKGAGSGIETLFSFSSIIYYLQRLLKKQKVTKKPEQENVVTFCQFQETVAECVIVMGLDEENYPRQERLSSLNLLKKSQLITSQEMDRALFLQQLLLTKDTISFTYTKQPSYVLQELMKLIENPKIIQHPFEERATRKKESTHPPFFAVRKKEVQPLSKVSTRQLFAHAKNPIRTYLQHNRGIYLERSRFEGVKSDENFLLEALDRAILRASALCDPFPEKQAEWERQNLLPIGGFKPASLHRLQQEIEAAKLGMQEMNIAPELFEISLQERPEGELCFPPLTIGNVSIVGKLQNLSQQGIIVPYKTGKEEMICLLPKLLLLQQLQKRYNLPIEPALVFVKNRKILTPFCTDSEQRLKEYLDYYFMSLQTPSPLIPEWVIEILTGSEERLAKKMQSATFNEYATLILQKGEVIPAKEILTDWKEKADQLFGELIANWGRRS